MGCPVKALLGAEDAGLRRVYDGVRKGLEQAQLPRVCLVEPGADPDAALRALEAEPPPLLFVLGAPAAERLGSRLSAVPRVYVDTAWVVNGDPCPRAIEPVAPAAVVRAHVSAARVSEVVRDLFPERPAGRLSWPCDAPDLRALADRLALAAGFRLSLPGAGGEGRPRVLLHLRLGLGEVPAPLDALLGEARGLPAPLLSDDLAHWGRGAALVVVPDHDLLGRVAADVARELLAATEPVVLRREIHVSEVRVDLRATLAQGLVPPVAFLAGADQLRGAGPGAAAAAAPAAPRGGGR